LDCACRSQCRASSRSGGNAVDDDNRDPVRDLHVFARAQTELSPPFDLGESTIADRLEIGFLDSGKADDVLVAHDERGAAVDDGAHRQLALKRYADLAYQNEIERRVERRRDLSATPPRGNARVIGR
jgi:hypothetical protein